MIIETYNFPIISFRKFKNDKKIFLIKKLNFYIYSSIIASKINLAQNTESQLQ